MSMEPLLLNRGAGACPHCDAPFDLGDEAQATLANVAGVVTFACPACRKRIPLLGGKSTPAGVRPPEVRASALTRPHGYTPMLTGLRCPDANCAREVEIGARTASLPPNWREQIKDGDIRADLVIVHAQPTCRAFTQHGATREFFEAVMSGTPWMRAT